MKEIYSKPDIEVVELEGKDILRTSEPPVIGGNDPPPDQTEPICEGNM